MTANELAEKLARRNRIIDQHIEQENKSPEEGVAAITLLNVVWNPYTECKELSRHQIQEIQKMFYQFDKDQDKHLNFEELKQAMERLGTPQTHLSLKAMLKEADEDCDGLISLKDFILIFRKAASGELASDSPFYNIYKEISEIDVHNEGVKGAKFFFEAKIGSLCQANKFEQEIKNEQDMRKALEEEKKANRAAFRQKASFFNTQN